MNSQDAIQQELTDLRSSLPLSNHEQPVFTVPPRYFENFAASVLAKIKSQPVGDADDALNALAPVLAAIPKHTPYQVPENYFEHLAIGLPALVNEEASPGFLQTDTKQTPYIVPPGYFDTLAAQVTAKVIRPQAKVVPLYARVVRFAAAAVVIGLIALATFFYLNGNPSTLDPAKQPAAWVAQKLKNIPKQDLEAFLKTVDADSSSSEVAQKGTPVDARPFLHDLSKQDLDAFLKEVPADVESAYIN